MTRINEKGRNLAMKKRVVTCPECEVKLSVFDFGKPINQKCPKCSKTFVIESEEKDEAEKADAAKSAGDGEKKAEASADDAKKTDATVKAAEDKGKEDKKEDKESKDKSADKSEKKDVSEKKSEDTAASSDKASDKKESAAKDKEITPKKSAAPAGGMDKPAASSTDLDDMELHAPAGPSPLFSVIMLGGLILVIVMQVMMKMRADKQYVSLIKHLQYIEEKLK